MGIERKKMTFLKTLGNKLVEFLIFYIIVLRTPNAFDLRNSNPNKQFECKALIINKHGPKPNIIRCT